ncbi:rRNA maturation RNase YbeY [Acetobacter conturbans]|uniref:Endoribonuclease YbeY n=1 Tax=Acetobacter conturbans TaxID=1737472 RepID=A0ABX0K083_9PROT|nr:rRNA maturation RNase YbeY [Acetobacter conturbans]NHN88519.1 rRNA maturation RNase YbeY [Acetobacter conturbans]
MEPPSTDGRPAKGAADYEPSPSGDGLFPFPPSNWGEDAGTNGDGPAIIVEDARWRAVVPNVEYLVRRACAASVAWAERQSMGEPVTVPETIVLSSDRVVKRLNARHRGRNKPTNVLTFEPMPGYPGSEIILALGVVHREAKAARKPVSHHLAHLVAHGILHLGGHDHHEAGEARRMEMEEARVLAMMGIPNPWKPRA